MMINLVVIVRWHYARHRQQTAFAGEARWTAPSTNGVYGSKARLESLAPTWKGHPSTNGICGTELLLLQRAFENLFNLRGRVNAPACLGEAYQALAVEDD